VKGNVALLRKFLPFGIIFVGIISIFVALIADLTDIGNPIGFGKKQIMLVCVGIGLVFVGFLFSLPAGSRLVRFAESILHKLVMPIAPKFVDQKPLTIIICALWFGLFTGLVEGVLLLFLQSSDLLEGSLSYMGSSLEIIWIAPLYNLVLFGVLGLILSLIAVLFPNLAMQQVSVFIFSLLLFLDWLATFLSGRILDVTILLIAISPAIICTRKFLKYDNLIIPLWYRGLPLLAALAFIELIVIQGGFWITEQLSDAMLPQLALGSPNIIMIVVDTLRADHLSSYGYQRETSPNIDQLAQEGVRFENAISPSSWTFPSHLALFRGNYQFVVSSRTSQRYPSIAEVLKSKGYRTGGFSGNYWIVSRANGFGRGFIHFEDYYRTTGDVLTGTIFGHLFERDILHDLSGLKYKAGRKHASDVTQSMLDWIAREPQKPFFAFINYFDIHDPYTPPQPYRSMFSQVENPGGLINEDWDMDHIYLPLTQEQMQSEIDAYDGSIAYVDDQIGMLLATLKERGLDKNTIIVILSDHGEMFGEHGLLSHANSLYLEVIKVPLIFWWPNHIPDGKTVSQPVTTAAIPATLLELLEQNQQPSFLGPSLSNLWNGSDGLIAWPDPISHVNQLSWVPKEDPTAYGEMFSVVDPHFHYIEHAKLGSEVYDWNDDPQEKLNLIGEPEIQQAVTQYKRLVPSIKHQN
jgi:arylsulfatase A-like enzyme